MTKQKIIEIIKYLIVGGLATLVSWITYSICQKFIINNVTISNIVSWIFAFIFAYFANRIYVFNSHEKMLKEFLVFLSGRIVTGIFEIVSVPLLTKYTLDSWPTLIDIEGLTQKILICVIVTISNYVISKLFVFKNA